MLILNKSNKFSYRIYYSLYYINNHCEVILQDNVKFSKGCGISTLLGDSIQWHSEVLEFWCSGGYTLQGILPAYSHKSLPLPHCSYDFICNFLGDHRGQINGLSSPEKPWSPTRHHWERQYWAACPASYSLQQCDLWQVTKLLSSDFLTLNDFVCQVISYLAHLVLSTVL